MECGVLVRALYEFHSDIEGELSLKVGSVLQFIRPVNQYWSYGCLDGFYGNFPTNYVVEIQLPDDVVVTLNASSSSRQRHPPLFVAKDRFKAEKPHQMAFEKGDIILGLEQLDDNWWRGRLISDCDNTKVRIFPLKYVWSVDVDLLKSRLKTGTKRVEMKGKVNMNLKAQLDEEIDLYKDDVVNITEIIDEDWYRGNCNGKAGIFPVSVITLLHETDSGATNSGSNSRPSSSLDLLNTFSLCGFSSPQKSTLIKDNSPKSSNNNISVAVVSANVLTASEKNLPHARTLYPFRGEFDNELSFDAGEIIELRRRISADWLEGETRTGTRGIFPQCYVLIVIDIPEEPVDAQPVHEETLVALYDFFPEVEGDVPVMEGERVTLLERPDAGWCKVRNGVGLIGLCPASYLEACPVQSKQWPERHWSLPAHSQRPLYRHLELKDDSSTQSAHLLNDSQWSVNPDCNSHHRFHTDSLSTAFAQSHSSPSPVKKMSPARPPLPDIITNSTANQETATSARVLRPAPAPPTNVQYIPRRSHSAVGSSGRSSVQLRHQTQRNRVRSSLRRNVVTMSDITTTDSTIAENSNDNVDVECRSRSRSGSMDSSTRSSFMELKGRNRDKRDMIIAELMKTERDFITDMEFCKTNFMSNPAEERRFGLDVDILFGNLDPVVAVSKKLLKSFEAVSSQPTEHKQVGNCFLEAADEMREAYGKYCSNHNEVIQLLEKYDEDRAVSTYIRQKLEAGGCSNNQVFVNLSSLVIKPIQRITKYPLFLNELVQVTEETSKDYSELITARHTMTEVANHINESKRSKDLVQKYRKDDTSISTRLSKISLHSVVKKSERIGMRLSSTLGLVSVTKDGIFDEEEQKFHDLEKSIKQLMSNIKSFVAVSEETIQVRLKLAEHISDFYDEERTIKVVDNFRTIQRVIAANYWPDFKRLIDKRVVEPLHNLLAMFEGPNNLILKRRDKLLDYDRASQRLEKNKDTTNSKMLRDELELARKNYAALNNQLIDELPKMTQLATEIFVHCIGAFIHARSKFIGLAAKQLLEMAESIPNLALDTDILSSFFDSQRKFFDRMAELGLVLPNSHPSRDEGDCTKAATSTKRSEVVVFEPQTSGQKTYLQGRYPNQLYVAVSCYSADDQAEIPLNEGDIVGVVIQKDPMGNSERWFVDRGASKGLVPAKYLTPWKAGLDVTAQWNTDKQAEASFESAYQSNYQSLNSPPPYSEVVSRSPSPMYHEPDENYEEINTNGSHRYYDVLDPLGESSGSTSPSRPRSSSTPPVLNANPTEYYEAAYEFRASGSTELSLARGQVVLVLNKEDMEGNREWWLAQDRYGREGYVPGNYLVPYNQK